MARMLSALRVDSPRLVRYATIGIAQNGFFYLVALVLIWFGWQAWQAVVVLTPPAIAITFWANRAWTFSGRARDRRQVRRYLLVYGLNYVFAVAFTWGQEAVGVPSWLASLITVGVAAIGNFLALNFLVFPDERQSTADDPQ